MRRFFLGLAVAAAWSAPPSVLGESPASPLDFPTLIKRWSFPGTVDAIRALGNEVAIAGNGKVALLDLTTGRARWEQSLGDEACYDCPLEITDGVVAHAYGSELYLLDLGTGDRKSTIQLPGTAREIVGPPWTVAVSGADDEGMLVRVDLATGDVSTIQPLSGSIRDVILERGVVSVIVSDSIGDEDVRIVEGFDATTLRWLWTLTREVSSDFELVDGTVYVQAPRPGGNCAERDRVPLDLTTGRAGSALPSKKDTDFDFWDFPLEIGGEEVSRHSDAAPDEVGFPIAVKRYDLLTGRVLWRTELPGTPKRALKWSNRLFVVCEVTKGRGLLVILDWQTGERVESAFGLPPDTWQVAVVGNLFLAGTGEGVIAFETGRFGPPERETVSPGEHVARVLLATSGGDSVFERSSIEAMRAELEMFGQPACRPIAELLPRLGPSSIVAAATFAERHRCPGIAPALGQLVVRPSDVPEGERQETKPLLSVLHALAVLGTDAEVPPVLGLMHDASVDAEIRRAAYETLASIGSPSAAAAVRAVLAHPAPSRSRFVPPGPISYLEYVGRPYVPQEWTEDYAERESQWRLDYLKLLGSRAASATMPNGERWVAFPSGYVGGDDDLWLARIDHSGKLLGLPLFTGLKSPELKEDEMLTLELGSDSVTIAGSRDAPPVSVRFATMESDRDQDGLTDLLELRMRLDPADVDTDGDSLLDNTDPTPGATIPLPRNDEDALRLALFDQLFRLNPEWAQGNALMVVVAEPALEWRGREGPTITLSEEQADAFRDEAGQNGISYLRFETIGDGDAQEKARGRFGVEDTCEVARLGDRAFTVSFYQGPLSASWYCAVARRLGPDWVLVRFDLEGIS